MKVTSTFLILLALAPFAAALAAPADAADCCAGSAGWLAPPEAICQWIAATPCCDDTARVVGFAFQPTPPPALFVPIADHGWKDSGAVRTADERSLLPLQRIALSTTVLLL